MDLIAEARAICWYALHICWRPSKKGEGILWLVSSVIANLCSNANVNGHIAAAHDKAEQPFLNKIKMSHNLPSFTSKTAISSSSCGAFL